MGSVFITGKKVGSYDAVRIGFAEHGNQMDVLSSFVIFVRDSITKHQGAHECVEKNPE